MTCMLSIVTTLTSFTGMKKNALRHFPKLFRNWLTKHVSYVCGTNRQVTRWDKSAKNEYISCHCWNKDVHHILHCLDKGCTTCFKESVEEINVWLKANHTDPDLGHLIYTAILPRYRNYCQISLWRIQTYTMMSPTSQIFLAGTTSSLAESCV